MGVAIHEWVWSTHEWVWCGYGQCMGGCGQGQHVCSECLNDQVDGMCVMMGVLKGLCGCGQMYASFPKYLLPGGNHW